MIELKEATLYKLLYKAWEYGKMNIDRQDFERVIAKLMREATNEL